MNPNTMTAKILRTAAVLTSIWFILASSRGTADEQTAAQQIKQEKLERKGAERKKGERNKEDRFFQPDRELKVSKLEKAEEKLFRKQEKQMYGTSESDSWKLKSRGNQKAEKRTKTSAGTEPAEFVNRGRYAPVSPYRERDGERLTTDLPPKYAELDTDFDGQVGLYEWITARRDDLVLFDQMDTDRDGLLTPLELQIADDRSDDEAKNELSPLAERLRRPRLVIVGAKTVTVIGSRGTAEATILSPADREKHAGFAGSVFPKVDLDKDGRISVEEVVKNPRLYGMFQKAKMDVKEFGAMSQTDFQNRFVEAMEYFAQQKANAEKKGRK